MPESKSQSLKGFKALSFDCYGTLIDWETGIHKALQPLLTQLPSSHPFRQDPAVALRRLDDISNALEKDQPSLPYNENLSQTLSTLAAELGIPLDPSSITAFGSSPGIWLPFPDTIKALEILSRHFKLIILSNIDNDNIAATRERLRPIKFDAVYTAQDIGSYKPAHANFRYLIARAKEDLDVDFEKGELLHVARSLTADHVAAKEIGLRSVWIARGGDEEGESGVGGDYAALKERVAFEWKYQTLGEFAAEVERQLGSTGGAE